MRSTLVLLLSAALLAACASPRTPFVPPGDVTPTLAPVATATPEPTGPSPAASPSLPATAGPTATPGTSATAGPPRASPTPAPTGPAAGACLTALPATTWLPAGSSAEFRLSVDPPCAQVHYVFAVDGLPAGWAAEFQGDATPFRNTLVVTTAETAPVGSYRLRVTATADAGLSAAVPIELEVVHCSEFEPGQFTRTLRSNLVELITAGKPATESGLLIPLQVCGGNPGRRLVVTLVEAVSEAGTPLADPPRFYLYRSWVWPAPDHIRAHGAPGTLNVQLPRTNSTGWQLEADLAAGLYLLVFERDYWGSPTDPQSIPASVTYRLRTLP